MTEPSLLDPLISIQVVPRLCLVILDVLADRVWLRQVRFFLSLPCFNVICFRCFCICCILIGRGLYLLTSGLYFFSRLLALDLFPRLRLVKRLLESWLLRRLCIVDWLLVIRLTLGNLWFRRTSATCKQYFRTLRRFHFLHD